MAPPTAAPIPLALKSIAEANPINFTGVANWTITIKTTGAKVPIPANTATVKREGM